MSICIKQQIQAGEPPECIERDLGFGFKLSVKWVDFGRGTHTLSKKTLVVVGGPRTGHKTAVQCVFTPKSRKVGKLIPPDIHILFSDNAGEVGSEAQLAYKR